MRTLLIWILLCVPVAQAGARDIKLMTTEYPPYYAPSLPNGGPITELVVEAFRKVGHRASIDFVPWVRAMEYAKAGKVDGLHGAWHSKEREQWFAFSERLPGGELVLFKRKGSQPDMFTSYAELRPYTIGIVREYRNPEAFEAANLRTDEAISDSVNLMKLAKRRVDLVLIDRALANFLLLTELIEYSTQLEAVEPPVEVLPMYLLISRKIHGHVEIANDFNRGIKLLRAEGSIERILQRHGM